jgi:hypothetical protein
MPPVRSRRAAAKAAAIQRNGVAIETSGVIRVYET